MTRIQPLILLPAIAVLLGGCVAGMVAGAVGVAADSTQGKQNSKFMQAAASQACRARAEQYGAVQVTGIQQGAAGAIVVSGTVADAGGKSSFQCSYVTDITDFALQRLQPGT